MDAVEARREAEKEINSVSMRRKVVAVEKG
jgi:hypothetical protein